MNIHFTEQDVIDACCVFAAQRVNTDPQDMDVDLQFNPTTGFLADARDVRKGLENIHLTQQNIIDGIATYLAEYHNFIPDRLRIDLQFNQQTGIEADIMVV
ncbi:DUF2653 family protein [Aneurinibacillus sp. Ricciae_BoGa-3]|uniref:DUF2653 family protein n=1 Tax=Aneurinibacillus sp. Ricciae_BoGa-3 TaxID=3022697 RepID=UPI002340F357|nr:DUF2653 family protein [Aneurinibacillus sp. Ricciae_BoGa-3]WCK55048.1 DUF2653 family protein [Aneurinibacillus sp. Ricciae_BoGa-3]